MPWLDHLSIQIFLYRSRNLSKASPEFLDLKEMVVETIELRFGGLPDSLAEKIHGMDDIDEIKSVHRKSISASSLNELVEMFNSTKQ